MQSCACAAGPGAGSATQNGTDPINAATGNNTQVATDYVGGGSFPLTIVRTYNSYDMLARRLSGHWSMNYLRRLILPYTGLPQSGYPAPDTLAHAGITLYRGDGKSLHFSMSGSVFVSDNAQFKLTIIPTDGGGSYSLFYPDTGETDTYDAASGALLKITNRQGLSQVLSYMLYTYNTLTTVSDPQGRKLKFEYSNELTDPFNYYKIQKITLPDGHVINYTYSGTGAMLSTVTYDGAATIQYLYENPSFPWALTGIIDQKNNRYVTWNYNSNGQAISSELAGGSEKITLSFGARTAKDLSLATTLTDSYGTSRHWRFADVGGVGKVAGIDAQSQGGFAAQNISYDAGGNAVSMTDMNGSVTTRVFDLSRNLETSRTEGAGTAQARTVTTTWHPTYNFPTQVAEPLKLTTYTYDAYGNVLTRTEQATSDQNGALGFAATPVGAARTWSWTYNAMGNVLTSTDPLSAVTTYTYTGYNGQSDLYTVTNSQGQTTTLENYDSWGLPNRITDANGLVTTLSYIDYFGKPYLASRTVGTETTSYTYDPVGLPATVSFPDGRKIIYTFDAAHHLTRIADSLGNHIDYTLDAAGKIIGEDNFDTSGQLATTVTRAFDTLGRLQGISGAAGQ